MISEDKLNYIWDYNKVKEFAEHSAKVASQYQVEMVNICRELGIEPNVGIADPCYYSDLIIEAIDNLKVELEVK